MAYLRSKWAQITGLPARLQRTEDAARAIVADRSRDRADRQRAARLATDAMVDRRDVEGLLREKLRVREGLGALPILLLVGGATAVALATTLIAIFGRASTYERELAAIGAGTLTTADIERLRRGADTGGGVAATLRETGNILKTALAAGAAWFAWKQWGA